MWETLRKEEVLQNLKTDQRMGLTKEEIQARKQKYGPNKLEEKKKEKKDNQVSLFEEVKK